MSSVSNRGAEVLIRGVELFDGTGAPSRRADILVTGSKVGAVEAPLSLPPDGREVLDGADLALCPGFIDVHSHADNAPFLDIDDNSKIEQGVTTEVVGNCGFSLAPLLPDTSSIMQTYSLRIFPPVSWEWSSFAEMLEAVGRRGNVTNYAALVGHHTIRIAAMGIADRPPTQRESAVMCDLVEQAADEGAFGLSTGLIYPPGLFATTEEIIELVARLPSNGIYASHIRGEGPQLLESLAEAIRVGEETGRRVHVSHLKAAGRPNWGMMTKALEVLESARHRGVDVRHDIYPYTAGSTMLSATLPPWFQDGGDVAVLQRLTDRAALSRLRDDLAAPSTSWENFVLGAGWDGIVVASSRSHTYDGRSISQIAEVLGLDPLDSLVHVLLTEDLQASMVVHHMHEDDLIAALRHPLTMVGSDGLPPGVGGKPHPRTYGTFPRILARFSRELSVLPLREAVRRMTSLPAQSFGLPDRGVVAPGMAADLVVFDPATVRDLADYTDPVRRPEGIAWVVQNGRVVVRASRYTGDREGRLLRPAPAT